MCYNRSLSVVVLLLFITKPAHFTSALAEEQRREINQLRSELNAAFDEHEQQDIAHKGVVVQPDWTQDRSAALPTSTKEEITPLDLAEIQVLRDEINAAISQDVNIANTANIQQIQELEEHFATRSRSDDADTVTVGAGHVELSDDGPNVVEAQVFNESNIDVRKLQRLEFSKRRTREVLKLKSIEEDFSFDLGHDVDQWAHIVHGGQESFIGRRYTDLLVVQRSTATYQKAKIVEVGQVISYLETYSYWNLEQQQQEGVILVTSVDKVLWLRTSNSTKQIELYWQWVVGYTISGLTHFTTQSKDYLAVSSNQSSRTGYYALNIYQFELHTQEFWIAQRLQMRHPCQEVTILDTGRDIIMAVAQNNTAVIYTFNPHADTSDHIRFQLRHTFRSDGVESIAGFQMGGLNYLALGGLQPQILLYQQGDFVPKTILGKNFGLVELFFPIPARTYRDDLILLVQHRVQFDTHSLTVLDSLIWNGEAFEASIPMPCKLGAHTTFGVSCMLDIQRDEGLKGATLLRRGNEVSVIVPRHNAESGLFRLHTELLAKNSELLDLQEIFEFLKGWVREEDEFIAQAQAFLAMSDAEIAQAQPDFSALETLKTPELFFTGNVGEIYVNDHLWTNEDASIDLDYIMQSIEQLEHDLSSGRHRRHAELKENYHETLESDSVEVEEDLTLESLNNAAFYIQNGELEFDGLLNLHSLEVLDKVSVAKVRAAPEETQVIDGDLEFEEINGISWEELKQNIMFRNVPLELTTLKVEGEVIVEDRLFVDVLNNLNFPDDFLWSNSPATSIVQAEKVFTNTLIANAVDTALDGTINGVNPILAVTLSEPQDWIGLPTFAQLEVTELLQLNGSAHGRDVEELPPNPTLEEASALTAGCDFKNLEVLGNVRVYGRLNGQLLGPILSDVVQRAENASNEIVIPSRKSFSSSVEFPVDFVVENHAVNGIPVDEFMTLHTAQELNISRLVAFIYFQHLNISGAYDGVQMEELLNNSIKIDEPQTCADTQLNFANPIVANTFGALTTLNGVLLPSGYQTTDENLEVLEAHFEHLQAQVANIPYDIVGNALLNGLDLRAFLAHTNWNMPAEAVNLHMDELWVDGELRTEQLYGVEARFVFDFLASIDNVPEMVLDGKIQVDQVLVTGDVQVQTLNGQNFDEDIQLTAIWLNRPNYLNTRLQFMEPLLVDKQLIVAGNYNGQPLATIIEDMVFRSANATVVLQAPKSFLRDVTVLGNLQLEAINDVPMLAIANKQNIQHFRGTLHIHGNLVVEELELGGSLNDYATSRLTDLVRYDRALGVYVLLGEVPLPHKYQLDDLTVYGNLNELRRLDAFFGNLVQRDEVCKLKGKTTFTGRVTLENGVYVGSLNGYNLTELLEQVVYVNSATPVHIQTTTTFAAPITARTMTVQGTLQTHNLHDCSLEEWLHDTLRVDQTADIKAPLNFVANSLHGNLKVQVLNDMNLTHLITLHTPQNLSSHLLFSTLHLDGQIQAQGTINGVNLEQEYANTLLNHGEQHVSTPLTLQSLLVLGNLQTRAPVNTDKDLCELATLRGDFEFVSPLYFRNVSTRRLYTRDLVSGIDLEQWFSSALWLNERANQRISGQWSIRNLTVKLPGTHVASPMSELGPERYPIYMRNAGQQSGKYETMCRRVLKYFWQGARRAYSPKHLEQRYELKLQQNTLAIRKAFALRHHNVQYLLLNLGCHTRIVRWNATLQQFEKLYNLETGPLEQLLVMPGSDQLEVVTKASQEKFGNCSFNGLNSWLFNNTHWTHLRHYEVTAEVLELHSSNTRQSFFALTATDLHEMQLGQKYPTQNWTLPITERKSRYRFVASSDDTDLLLLTDGQQLLRRRSDASVTYSSGNQSLHNYQQSVSNSGIVTEYANFSGTQSVLKPNDTLTRKLTFADFKQVVERILTDLVYRLHLEVNITQLSIPESDLYDEHLLQDFVDIMQELQLRQLYPPHTFADIDVTKLQLQLQNNPAQVLAARTLQIVWPVMVEIEEVHSHLRHNTSHEHPICSCISSNLGAVVRDVLLLVVGSGNESSVASADHTQQLDAVIQRIRHFQYYLEAVTDELDAQIKAELQIKNLNATPVESSEFSRPPTETMANSSLTSNATAWSSEGDFLLLPGAGFDHLDSREILSLKVGTTASLRTFFAVSGTLHAKLPIVGPQDVIKLYSPEFGGHIFQTIAAHKPHSLTALRLRDEAFLAFMEGCCLVRLLIYRGVQGFMPFAEFHTPIEVNQLLNIKLPQTNGVSGQFLAAVSQRQVVFYEFMVAGATEVPDFSGMCDL